MSVLITGGTGYIGSHTIVELLDKGYELVVLDNFCNSKPCVIDRIEQITGKSFKFYEADLLDYDAVDKIFAENDIDSVIHFAGLKAVGESVEKPLLYYHNNITGTLNLCSAMKAHGVKTLVFSSSATVYGRAKTMPITEDFPLSAANPYGQTKLMIEQILGDLAASDGELSISVLRYFNPIGAHKSGLIGEDPNGIPNNLLPFVTKVGVGAIDHLEIYGNDYDTPDGTGIRDYIHVVDLATAHIAALKRAMRVKGIEYYNIGTGVGYSVLEIVNAYMETTGLNIPYKFVARRKGDAAVSYSDPSKAEKYLGWKARYGIKDMCMDAYNWQKKNPQGYGD